MIFIEFEHNDNWKIKKFPCSCCLVKPACNDYTECDLLEANYMKIYNLIINENKCPDCGRLMKNPMKNYLYFVCPDCEHCFKITSKYKMAWRYIL